MIQHLHSIACVRALIDSNSGMPSYIDIIDGITLSSSEKLKLPPFVLVSKFWVKSHPVKEQKLMVEVSRKFGQKSNRIVMQEMDFEVGGKGENILIQLGIENLVVEEAGIWEFEVRWKLSDDKNWRKATSVPISVKIENKNKQPQK